MKKLLSTKNTAWLLIWLMAGFYFFMPLAIYLFVKEDPLYLKTAALTLIAVMGITLGRSVSIPLLRINSRKQKLPLNQRKVVGTIFIVFAIFIVVTTYTAPTIPLLSALQGKDVAELSLERGEFLKGREGGWIVLLYLSSMFASSIVPYVVMLAYETRNKFRHSLASTYLVFSVIFMVKALFLNLAIPAVSFLISRNAGRLKKIVAPLVAATSLIFIMIWLSGYGALETQNAFTTSEYFSTAYIPSGTLDFFIYRAFAVPIFSVVDTLFVHSTQLGGDVLWGSTSSLIAAIAGIDKINIERMVAEYQYGGWNDFANSNVAFFVDGYLNFGWPGVFIFGIIVGKCFRQFAYSEDPAFRSLSLLFAYQLLSSPLIQMLLSNGWLLLFIALTYFSVRQQATGSKKPSLRYRTFQQ